MEGDPLSKDKDKCKLYISNIHEKVSKQVLYELLVQTSPVASLHYPYDNALKRHCAYCIVEYPTEHDADYAYKVMNRVSLYGRPLRFYKMRVSNEVKLHVQNFDDKVDEKMLYDIFSKCGRCDVRIPHDDNGRLKQYAFVTFYSYENSDRAIELGSSTEIFGKRIAVDYALKKDGSGERYGTSADRAASGGPQRHASSQSLSH